MYYFNFKRTKPQAVREALRIAVIIALALLCSLVFRLQQGNWITITVTFLYLGGCINGLVLKRIGRRFIAAPLGFGASYLFIASVGFYDYRAIYIIPLVWIIAFYYFFQVKDYFGFVFFFLFFFLLLDDILAPANRDFNIFNIWFARCYCTFIGGLLVLFGEFFIFPDSTKSLACIKPQFFELLKQVGDVVDNVSKNYLKGKKLRIEYCNHLISMNSHIQKIKEMAAVNKYEVFNYTKSVDELLNLLTDILDDTKELVQLCNYYPDVTNVELDQVEPLVESIKNLIDNIANPNIPPVIYEGIQSREKDQNLFCQTLRNLAEHLHKLNILYNDISRQQRAVD